MTLREAIDEMTPTSVEGWLGTLYPGERMTCGSCHYCLFAKYLSWVTGCEIDVGSTSASSASTIEICNLPGWACTVIRRFDNGSVKSRGVTASLRILREVCPELSA